jgi:hypothetical protein
MNNTERADMDSSPPFRLRTAIVVVSMIALPLIAVCGVKLQKVFSWGKSDSATAKSSDPSARPGVSIKNAPPAPPAAPHVNHSHAYEPPEQHGSQILPAGGSVAGSLDPNSASFPVVQAANSDVHATGNLPAGSAGTEPARIYPLPPPEAEGAQPMPPPAVVAEQFSAIQQRLRAMGATHYVLETWGPQGDMYRFQCRMSAGHHPGYTRQFEAIDDDALRVMRTVLDEIDAWRAGRLP